MSQAWRVLTCVFTVQNIHSCLLSPKHTHRLVPSHSHSRVCMHTRNLSVQSMHRLMPSLFSVQNIYIQTCAFIVQSLYTDLCVPYQSKACTQTCAFSVQNMLVDLCLLTLMYVDLCLLSPEHAHRLKSSQSKACIVQTDVFTVHGMSSSN